MSSYESPLTSELKKSECMEKETAFNPYCSEMDNIKSIIVKATARECRCLLKIDLSNV